MTAIQLPHMLGRIYDDRIFWRAMKPLGMSLRSFRYFLKAIGVPTLRVGGRRFVDSFTLAMAFRAIMRLGRKDFAAPGSVALQKGGSSLKGCTTRLDVADLEDNYWEVIMEMALSQKWNRLKNDEKMVKASKAAVERMRAAIISATRHEAFRATSTRRHIKRDDIEADLERTIASALDARS